jgi:hypothetical protein
MSVGRMKYRPGLEKEMIFLLLLRRLSPRTRLITGVVLVAAGLVVVAVSAVTAGLLIHGIILTAIGAAMCLSALASGRRARRTTAGAIVDRPTVARAIVDRPTVDEEPSRAGSGHGR